MSNVAAALPKPLHVTGVEITRREIQIGKSRKLPLPKTSNPLKECHCGVQIFSWIFLVARPRRVLAIPATSASLERLLLTSGDTKKWCSVSCDNLEKCVYLHKTWSQAADKKVLDMDYFILLALFFFLDL